MLAIWATDSRAARTVPPSRNASGIGRSPIITHSAAAKTATTMRTASVRSMRTALIVQSATVAVWNVLTTTTPRAASAALRRLTTS